MRIFTTALIYAMSALGMATAGFAHEGGSHHAHEHGIGQLDLAVDGNAVQIELTSPAIDIVGFEHEPRDAGERASLDKAVSSLRDSGHLMSFNGEAKCLAHETKVRSSLLDHDDVRVEHGAANAPREDEDEDEHADIAVSWSFECANPQALHELDTSGFFRRFPHTEKLRVQAATGRGQTATDLTATAPKFSF